MIEKARFNKTMHCTKVGDNNIIFFELFGLSHLMECQIKASYVVRKICREKYRSTKNKTFYNARCCMMNDECKLKLYNKL